MTGSSDKKTLRKHYRALRDAISAEHRDRRSAVIAELLLSIEKVEHALHTAQPIAVPRLSDRLPVLLVPLKHLKTID